MDDARRIERLEEAILGRDGLRVHVAAIRAVLERLARDQEALAAEYVRREYCDQVHREARAREAAASAWWRAILPAAVGAVAALLARLMGG